MDSVVIGEVIDINCFVLIYDDEVYVDILVELLVDEVFVYILEGEEKNYNIFKNDYIYIDVKDIFFKLFKYLIIVFKYYLYD